jgi:hypothetical protein
VNVEILGEPAEDELDAITADLAQIFEAHGLLGQDAERSPLLAEQFALLDACGVTEQAERDRIVRLWRAVTAGKSTGISRALEDQREAAKDR